MKQNLLMFFFPLTLFLSIGLIFDSDNFFYALTIDDIPEREKIKQTVMDFNKYFMDIYASQGSKQMIDSIPGTTEIRHRIYKDAGHLAFSGKVLVYDMASLTIENIRRTGPFHGELLTKEEWNYVYQDSTTRKTIAQIKGMEVQFRYFLIKKGGRWLVYRYNPVRYSGETDDL